MALRKSCKVWGVNRFSSIATDYENLFFHSNNLVAPMLQALHQAFGMWRPIGLLLYPVMYTHNNYPDF